MPYSSSALTSEASEKRGGGSVKCCDGSNPEELDAVALLHRRQHVVRVVLDDVVHALLIHRDIAGLDQRGAVGAQHRALLLVRRSRPASSSTATVSNIAGAIWHATVRFQISEYRRY